VNVVGWLIFYAMLQAIAQPRLFGYVMMLAVLLAATNCLKPIFPQSNLR
jgi:hypothetical protein